MGTRAAAFTAKIRTLTEFHNRIVSGMQPQPPGNDVATTIKYFSTVLLSVLKEVPSIPLDVLCSREKDSQRISMFPNLDYPGLYQALIQMLDCLHLMSPPSAQGVVGQALLHTLSCLLPFLDHDYMDTLPYLTAMSLAVVPSSQHKEVIDMLCYNFLPFTVSSVVESLSVSGATVGKKHILTHLPQARHGSDHLEEAMANFANISIPSVLMMVFVHTDSPANYTQLLETLMKLKNDVCYDLLCVIAHGTVKARCPAIELLFQYWPELNPSALDRKTLLEKHAIWTPLKCQNENCSNKQIDECNDAVKMCMNHTIAISSTGDKPPPLLLCIDCTEVIYKGRSRETLFDILLPLAKVPYTCVNIDCKSTGSNKTAVATCFSIECANYHKHEPVRYCKACHEAKHLSEETDPLLKMKSVRHIVHESIPCPWAMNSEHQSYFSEAIISLLREAQPLQEKPGGKEGTVAGSSAEKARAGTSALPTDESTEAMALEERTLLSRYGIWLMTNLCTPNDDTPEEVLGRIIAMLFNWFNCTACLPDDQAGSALERTKGEIIHGWLMKVVKTHFQVFVNCLLPHPVEYAKVGGHWDSWPSQSNQIKEGFKRLQSLVPYDIITPEVWSYIMPYWMECFRHEVPEEELAELKILLSKVLDPDLSPLGFTTKQMYDFISSRLDNCTPSVQEQALNWMQVLTMLEVPVPIKLLLTMLETAMNSLGNRNRSTTPYNKTVKIVANISKAEAIAAAASSSGDVDHKKTGKKTEALSDTPSVGNTSEDDSTINCYILMLDILYEQMKLQEVASHKGLDTNDSRPVLILLRNIMKAPWPGNHTCQQINLIDIHGEPCITQCILCELCAIWYQLALLLIEYFAPVVEISITDVAGDSIPGTSTPIPPVSAVTDDSAKKVEDDDGEQRIWKTQSGLVEFKISELPVDHQLLFVFLREIETCQDADILYHLLGSLKLMCLNADVLNKAVKNHRGFAVYIQETLLMSNLWTLLQAEFSQISQLAVPLLLHSITLPSGRDMFWKLVENDFHAKNFRTRFTAVERVTTIAHFLDAVAVKNSSSLQSSLANAFCYLVHCLDDIESTVAQRALLNLETIKTTSLKLLLWCLETQFDLVILDRPMILQTVFQLYNHLSDRRFLTWDFFLNRFDTLFVEAQIGRVIDGVSHTRDLKNTNINSEVYQKKLMRAQEALNHAHVSRSLSASFGGKFTRSVSAPLPKTPTTPAKRTISAPTSALRRKSIRSPAALPEKFQALAGANNSNVNASSESFHQKDLEAAIQEENHLMSVVHRASDPTEDGEVDDSMHMLITLLMQFLSRPDQSHPSEEKTIQKNQQIVLRHMNILLGYSPTEKTFLIPPSYLRSLPVFSAFITAMPKVLDFNHKMGGILTSTCIPLLIYCPSPQKYLNDASFFSYYSASSSSSHHHHSSHHGHHGHGHSQTSRNILPFYSLYLLKSHVRQSWLTSVLIILYKVLNFQQILSLL